MGARQYRIPKPNSFNQKELVEIQLPRGTRKETLRERTTSDLKTARDLN
jgi:hypothetical protein